ncbi:MAG TPA: N-acetylmuramoyl-L-alanine amidase [Terracidiphilus sp.]|nr:N-acetylmuramoyl-L-alanine amidase [Terracidiphilus sp.]
MYRPIALLLRERSRFKPEWRKMALGAALGAAALGTAIAQAPAAPAAPQARFVVVLDAAHGGDDAGANLNGQPEKAYTLALSVRLRSLLEARGISVVTTRESDATVDAEQRAQVADHARAQACLILHATESGFGVHLFTTSLAAAQPAVFEPWKTAQAAWETRSVALEGVLNSALGHAGLHVTMGRTELTTLDSMTCPAVAVEIAPSPAGANSLSDDSYQSQVADALAGALLEWRAEGGQL